MFDEMALRKENAGVTLVELLIVVSIIGILAVALGFSYEGWMGNYRIESVTKDMFGDLMDAKMRALTTARVHFINLEATGYSVYDDTNPGPDGNGTLETDTDSRMLQKTLPNDYRLIADAGEFPRTLTLNTRGSVSPSISVWIDHDKNPDYDCISINQTRIHMGKMSGGSCGIK